MPSSPQNISMGGRKIRFLNSISLSFNGENNLLAMFHSPSFFLYHIMPQDKIHKGKGKRRVRTMLFLILEPQGDGKSSGVTGRGLKQKMREVVP